MGPPSLGGRRVVAEREAMALVAGYELAVVTDNISCRVADDKALLRCRSCGAEEAARTLPRPSFLAAVRHFIHQHRTCLAALSAR